MDDAFMELHASEIFHYYMYGPLTLLLTMMDVHMPSAAD